MRMGKTYLEIAEFRVGFQGEPKLIETLQNRYAEFVTDSAPITISLSRCDKLTPKFRIDENIPEISYLGSGFTIDQAPYFYTTFDQASHQGTIEFTEKVHRKSIPTPPDDSPLPFGLRRAIGVLIITLLSRDKAPGFHAAALEVNGHGIIAPGDSGTGKSTFFSMFPENMQLNDEFVIVRMTPTGPRIFSTPFSETWDKNRKSRSANLRLLIKLTQAPHIETSQLHSADIIHLLNHNVVLPAEAEREQSQNFDVIFEVSKHLTAQELSFTLDGAAVMSEVRSIAHSL